MVSTTLELSIVQDVFEVIRLPMVSVFVDVVVTRSIRRCDCSFVGRYS